MRQRALVIAFSVLLASCGGNGSPRELIVSTAASLNDVFAELAIEFEASHPGVDVVLNTGGSSRLREQILAGAPVDVFASASVAVMEAVVAADLVDGEPVVFAENRLVLAVPVGNPAAVTGLADLADPGLLVGVCAAEVPCGALAAAVLAAAGIEAAADTEEPDVRALSTKLELSELDVGLVYATDLVGNPLLVSIPIDSADLVTQYSIAVIEGSATDEDARAFIDFILSDRGSTALSSAGFGIP
jgi:molybdate transport system substrate-binding protein